MTRRFPQEILPELISYLETLARKGVRSLYLDRDASVREAVVSHPPSDAQEETMPTTQPSKNVIEKLAALEQQVGACVECGLHKGRTNGVFGTGDPATKVMFIGEGPGRDEDLQGKPFVGRSGQLLTKILAAIDLRRDDVYITNIVKCRPPNNRDPQEDEVRCCEKYLAVQIDLIRPRIICALGRIAAHWLLDTKAPLSALRESDNEYRGIPVLVTYHPAALLRNPALKRGAWDDFKRLRTILDD